jgi:hypothetical protein
MYVKPLKKRAMGPASATIREAQRVALAAPGDRYVIDTVAAALDVPYGDAFQTRVRYVLTRDPDNEGQSVLHVSADIVWTKGVMSMVRSMVVRTTLEGIEAYACALSHAVSAHLGGGAPPLAAST